MIDSYSDFVIHTRSGFCCCHELLSEHVSFRSRKIKTVSLFNRRDIVCCLRNIASLVGLLLDSYFVRVIGVCHVIPRGVSHIDLSRFAQRVEILKQYLSVVLESLPNVFCWLHKAFSHPAKDLYLADGVHVNPAGQYHLYRSYRGAIFQALKML